MAVSTLYAPTTSARPFEPLSISEIEAAVALVRPHVADTASFASVALVEPDKALVASLDVTGPCPRAALITGFDQGSGTFAAEVDLIAKTVSVESISDGGAPIHWPDVEKVVRLTKADPDWQAAMAKRGITTFELVQIDPWPTGGYIHPDVPEGHRVMRAISFLRTDKTDNGYARPIQGLIAHVDLTADKVVHVEDTGVVAIPPEAGRYDAEHQTSFRTDLKPIEITQPEGPSYIVDGYNVAWQGWEFSVSMHPTHGLILHQLGYRQQSEDGAAGELRNILYRASLSDMVVPYGDTNHMHAWKHVFDASEAAIGTIANALKLGCDCLGEIHYFDINVVNWDGKARTIPNAICLHEEDYGILWKHRDGQSQTQEVRRQRRLVISSMHTVGNYEYGFFWYLYLDGTIQMEVKLTGIVGVSAVEDGGEDPEFAPLIAPGLASPVHQHLFCFRLDFDLDGGANRIYEVEAEPLPMGDNNPHGTAFRAKASLLPTEGQAIRDNNTARSRSWKVVNQARTNRMGKPVAFKFLPNPSPTLLAHEDSPVAKRAGFAKHNLWVTPYDPAEMSAAGEFTNLHPGGDGLPRWTAANRDIVDQDLVVWHTVGVTHVPRPEDWPVMPVEYCGFMLQPVGFFERNPTLDVPPSKHG